MSECCTGNNEEILNILMGYAYSEEVLKKSLWWITRDLENKFNKVIIIDDGKCGNIRQELKNYESRIQYQIIKVDNNRLLNNFKISSLRKSPKLAYAICEKYASEKKVFMSTRNICFNYSFSDFIKKISNEEVVEMRSYLIPNYLQECITEYSSNFCGVLAIECSKYPLYTEDFPAKNDNYVVKAFCGSDKNKNKYFTDYNCYHYQIDGENETEHLENIDLSLIDNVVEYI